MNEVERGVVLQICKKLEILETEILAYAKELKEGGAWTTSTPSETRREG